MPGPVHAELLMHPSARTACVHGIAAELQRGPAGTFHFAYRLGGAVARLRLPASGPGQRSDGLWQHSCFEAFLRPDGDSRYLEFNFAPSGAWACYRFTGRRSGRTSPPMPAPSIEIVRDEASLSLVAELPPGALPELAQAPVQAGLAAVIEDERRMLSYWALAHAGDTPDFHDPSTFTLALEAP